VTRSCVTLVQSPDWCSSASRSVGSSLSAGIELGEVLRAEKREMRYLILEVCAELVGLGMMVLYFESRIASVSELSVNLKRHSLPVVTVTATHCVTVLCSPSNVSQAAVAPSLQWTLNK
jgi:hypothetical protein